MKVRSGTERSSETTAEAYGAGAGRSLIDALKSRVSHTAELAAVEFRYASVSALAMLMLVVIASATLVVSWGLVLAALLAALAAAGYPWPAIAVGLAALHVVAALVCWQLVMKLSHNLSMPALRAAFGDQRKDE
ncbi:MAG TPA: hypothetical protein VMR74_05695 [Gammaproteobacteria bacterium]|nr:hypothetical protein [Gammaproteobacteria bacterium]